jgi:hypothetical protein
METSTQVEVHWMNPANNDQMENLRTRLAEEISFGQYMRMVFEQRRFIKSAPSMSCALLEFTKEHHRQQTDEYGMGRVIFKLS